MPNWLCWCNDWWRVIKTRTSLKSPTFGLWWWSYNKSNGDYNRKCWFMNHWHKQKNIYASGWVLIHYTQPATDIFFDLYCCCRCCCCTAVVEKCHLSRKRFIFLPIKYIGMYVGIGVSSRLATTFFSIFLPESFYMEELQVTSPPSRKKLQEIKKEKKRKKKEGSFFLFRIIIDLGRRSRKSRIGIKKIIHILCAVLFSPQIVSLESHRSCCSRARRPLHRKH